MYKKDVATWLDEIDNTTCKDKALDIALQFINNVCNQTHDHHVQVSANRTIKEIDEVLKNG